MLHMKQNNLLCVYQQQKEIIATKKLMNSYYSKVKYLQKNFIDFMRILNVTFFNTVLVL